MARPGNWREAKDAKFSNDRNNTLKYNKEKKGKELYLRCHRKFLAG